MTVIEVATEIVKTRNTIGTIKTDDINNMRIIITCYDHLTKMANELTQIANEQALKEQKDEPQETE